MNTHHMHIVSAREWGGGESYVFNLAKHALTQGDTITVITDARYPEIGRRFSQITTPVEVSFSLTHWGASFRQLIRLVNDRNISVINYHSGKVALLSVMIGFWSKRPCVFFKHNIIPGKKDVYHNFLMNNLAAVICVSDAVKKSLIQGVSQRYAHKAHMVHAGIELPTSIRRTQSDRVRIGYAGRIVPNKGVEVLLEAFEQLPEQFELVIAGNCNSEYGRQLQSKFKSHRIHFLGELEKLDSFYRAIDVFVAPSLVAEAFGLVICEAMSYGVPVITTTSGAQAEIIQDGLNGLLVSPNDKHALTEAINNLSTDSARMRMMGENARKRIEEAFTMELYYRRLQQVYRSLSKG